MATIIDFRARAKRRRPAAALPAGPAKILLFTGIRYERTRLRPARAAANEYVRKLRVESIPRP